MDYTIDWLTDNLAVGPAPMSYDNLDRLRELGIGAILNLCAEFCDLHQIEEKAGFEVWYLPIEDESAPELAALEKALDWLDECLYLGKKVLVHCRFGIGRTGTVVNAYLLRKGLGHRLAWKKLKGRRSQPANFDQWWFIRKYGKKEKRLTIREPSLAHGHLVDLFPFLRDYEKMVAAFDERLAGAGGGTACCRCGGKCGGGGRIMLSLVEAVYLHHFLDISLSRQARGEAIGRAVSAQLGQAGVPGGEPGPEATSCPLLEGDRCLLYARRTIACRLAALPPGERAPLAAELRPMLRQLSGEIHLALTSRFPGPTELLFSLEEVVSGRFVQAFFHLLRQEADWHNGRL